MTTTKLTLASSLALLAAACGDGQATPEYKGESLLEVHAVIEASPGVVLSEVVVPVVLWSSTPFMEEAAFVSLEVQDVDVRGSFPGRFQLDVFSTPPQKARDAMPAVPGFENEPRIVTGFLGALPLAHDANVTVGAEVTSTCESKPDGVDEVCYDTYCDFYGQCWDEKNDGTDQAVANEAVHNGLGLLKGLVRDYELIYLDKAALPGSLTAFRYGEDELAAGFHLVKVSEREASAAEETCWDDALELATPRFASETGLDPDSDLSLETLRILETFAMDEVKKAGCFTPGDDYYFHFEVVDLDQTVTMELGADIEAVRL